MKRGTYLFRYECAMPGCTATIMGDAACDGHHQMPSTYHPPAPWLAEFGGVWCPDHRAAVEAYRAECRAWAARRHAHTEPAFTAARALQHEWEQQNPAPVPPWRDAPAEPQPKEGA